VQDVSPGLHSVMAGEVVSCVPFFVVWAWRGEPKVEKGGGRRSEMVILAAYGARQVKRG
jgi:hypothetical protein